MTLKKQGDFSFNHTDQPTDIYKIKTPDRIKSDFDSRAAELKNTLNALIDALASVQIGNSGAQNIGSETITGVSGSNIHDQLKDLYYQINNIVLGQIPEATKVDLRTDSTKALNVEVRTDDPANPTLGQIWLRSDL